MYTRTDWLTTVCNFVPPNVLTKLDYQGVRRCWNLIRFYFEPVFETRMSVSSQTPPSNALETEMEGQPQAEEQEQQGLSHPQSHPPQKNMALIDIYRFLCQRGEKFEGGFPSDEAKWKPLYSLIRATFYTKGENDEDSKVYTQPRGCFVPAMDTVQEQQVFWTALQAGDLVQVSASLSLQPELVNLPNYKTGHLPLTSVAAMDNISLRMLHLLLASYAFTDGPGE